MSGNKENESLPEKKIDTLIDPRLEITPAQITQLFGRLVFGEVIEGEIRPRWWLINGRFLDMQNLSSKDVADIKAAVKEYTATISEIVQDSVTAEDF